MSDHQVKRYNMSVGLVDVTSREPSGNDWVAWADYAALLEEVEKLRRLRPVLCPKCHGTGRVKIATQIAPGVRGCHFHDGEPCECGSGAVLIGHDDYE